MQRAGTGRKLTVWAVEAPAGEVDDEPAPSPSTDLAGSGAAPPAPEASAVPASPAILARVARGMMLFGVAVALFIGYEFPLSALYQQQNQSSLLSAFKEQLPTGNLDKASALLPEASPVALLRISRLHLQQIVVEGSTPSDLKLGPGHLRVSPLPGEVGNSVILGRRTTYGAPFAGLPLLKNGDRISVTTGRGVFTYVVSATGRSARTDAGPMLANANNVLTLVTSDPLLQATDRYWVRAKLSGKAVAIASRAPAAANPDDLGLTSEFGPLILAVIASQLLVGTGWLAWRYRRHWPGTVTYLLAAPILVALLLVTFSYFDAMLPGTL